MSRIGLAGRSALVHVGLAILVFIGAWRFGYGTDWFATAYYGGYTAAFIIWLMFVRTMLRRHFDGSPVRLALAASVHLLLGYTVLAGGFSSDDHRVFLQVLLAVVVLPGLVTWWAAEPTS